MSRFFLRRGAMSIDSLSNETLFACVNWALETGIWGGRSITWESSSDLEREVEQKLLNLLFSKEGGSFALEQMATAYLGSTFKTRALMGRAIERLGISSQGVLILPAGLGKGCSKFWKKHKTEILIGLAVVAVITTVVVVTYVTGGVGSSAAAAGGGALIDSLSSRRKEEEEALPEKAEPIEPPPLEPKNPPLFLNEGFYLNGQYFTYSEGLEKLRYESGNHFPTSPSIERPFAAQVLDAWVKEHRRGQPLKMPEDPRPSPNANPNSFWRELGFHLLEPELKTQEMPVTKPDTSRYIQTEGTLFKDKRIGFINGINTKEHEGLAHTQYLQKLANGMSIDFTYNQTHSIPIDAIEAAALNLKGYSPNTANLMRQTWTAFHEENLDNTKKYLHICHSQGAIHTKNALKGLPEEVRNRVIVVAVAPAAIVSKALCYEAYNYASSKDLVPYAELASAIAEQLSPLPNGRLNEALEARKQLIILDPHPDATGIDHDFQSLTFLEVIKKHIDLHLCSNGECK